MSLASHAFVMSDIGRDPVFAEWLAGEGLTLPIYPENGRFPTYLEVLALVTGIDGYTVPDASEVDAEHDYRIIVEDSESLPEWLTV